MQHKSRDAFHILIVDLLEAPQPAGLSTTWLQSQATKKKVKHQFLTSS